MAAPPPVPVDARWVLEPARVAIGPAFARGASGIAHKGMLDGRRVCCKTLCVFADPVLYNAPRGSEAWLGGVNEFWHEIVTLAAVAPHNFPNVFRFYGVVLADGAPMWLVTELADESLESMLCRGGLNAQWVRDVLRDVLTGLRDLGSVSIVHRDVKPANVLVFRQKGNKARPFVWKLGDVGEGVVASGPVSDAVGSPFYRAPEVGGGAYTTSVDVFSFGIMGIEMVLRVLKVGGMALVPDPARTYTVRRRKEVVKDGVARLQAVWPSMGRVLRGCTTEDPSQRWTAEHALNILCDDVVEFGARLAVIICDDSIVLQCAVALRSVALALPHDDAEDSSLHRRLVLAGCLEGVYAAMDATQEDIEEQELGCAILGYLAEGVDPANEVEIVTGGGLSRIFAAMDSHASSERMQFAALAALADLTVHEASSVCVVDAGGIARAYECMDRFPAALVQGEACRLLGSLTRGNPTHQVLLRESGGLDRLAGVVTRYGAVPDMQLGVLWALWNAGCTPQDAVVKSLISRWAAWEEALRLWALNHHLPRVQEFGCWVVYSLGSMDEGHSAVLRGDRRFIRAVQLAQEAHGGDSGVALAAAYAMAFLED